MAERGKGHESTASGPITSVEVVDLFDKFNYRVDLFTGSARRGRSSARLFAASEDRLTLIYGKNGSGKTTLLRLLYHALSAGGNRGHRGALRKARFSRLTVELSGGTRIEYLKTDPVPPDHMLAVVEHQGERTEWLHSGGSPRDDALYTFDTTGQLVIEVESGQRRFVAALESLAINPVFLADTRVLESDLTERSPQ